MARLAVDRRGALYEDFIAMKKVMLARATSAVAALDAGLPEAERRRGWEL